MSTLPWSRLRSRFSKVDLRLGARLALSAVAAMVVSRALGLHAVYWAGISAIIVSTGSPGGSFSASLVRFGGTLAGLASGTVCVWALGHTLLASALAIPLAIAVCQASGLKASVKVAALSTLFPVMLAAESHGLGATVETALSRAGNVLLGCLVTLLLDGLVWPERNSRKWQVRFRRDVGTVGQVAAGLLERYLDGRGEAPDEALAALQAARLTYAEILDEMNLEPEDPEAPRERLAAQTEILHVLVDHCAALKDIQAQAAADQIQGLLGAELRTMAGELRTFGEGFRAGGTADHGRLKEAEHRLEAGYEEIRGARGTQAFPSREVFRLAGALYLCGALVRSLGQLEA
jgi:uncharacterized membrane protein YccC